MIRRHKTLKRPISTLIFLLFMYFMFYSSKKYFTVDDSVFCVGNDLVLTLPSTDGVFMEPNIPPNTWKTYDSLQDVNNLRIFFHETSGDNQLGIIQCCSIESAAKHHPFRPIQLFVRPKDDCFGRSTPLSTPSIFYKPAWLQVLSQYPNVSVILLNEKKYFLGTPMEDWYIKKDWRKSPFSIAHLSDYIRILSLYKGGGLYLDLDILTLKPYIGDIFHNFLVYGSARMDHISNGAMHLEFGHWFSKEIMKELKKEYEPNSYTYHGPDVVSEVMKNVCGLTAGNPNSNQCKDIHLLSDKSFYPIPSIFSGLLFQENENTTQSETFAKIKKSFGLHSWNSLSRFQKSFDIDSNQILAVLAKKHCPITVSMAKYF
jgi:lactosylceramide 4-alpha-galactosyltransferase